MPANNTPMNCRHNSYVSEAVNEDVLLALKGDPCQSLHPQEGACGAGCGSWLLISTLHTEGGKKAFPFKMLSVTHLKKHPTN